MDQQDAATRAPIGALEDEETFLSFAQHLKALHLRMAERERMYRATRRTLQHQIGVFSAHCLTLAERNGRCRAMWHEVEKELAAFRTDSSGG